MTGEQRAPTIIDKSKSAEINVGQTIEFFAKVAGAPMPTGMRKSIINVNRVRGTIDLADRLMCVLTLKMRSSDEGQKESSLSIIVGFFSCINNLFFFLVTWTRKGMPIETNELYQLRPENDTHYLLIKQAVADVVGTYVITAANSAGKVSGEIDLTITGK